VSSAVLLTSELTTNVVVHTARRFEVQIADTGHGVRVSVHDRSTTLPVMRPATRGDPHGRGMHVVAALASRWGSERRSGAGKTTWFELDVGDAAT
jgi:hypothetical protein